MADWDLPSGTMQQAFGHHRVAAGIELYGPDYIITVEIRDLDDYGMYRALGYENADYGNRNAHYNEIVEAARNWFDEVIFEQYPTWEEVEKSKAQICAFDSMPTYQTLLAAFGGNERPRPLGVDRSIQAISLLSVF